jgi:putative ABC transport system permease protein
MTTGDARALQDQTLHPDIAKVAPEYNGNEQLVYGSNNSQSSVSGVTLDFFSVRNLTVASGRLPTAEEIENQSQVVVIGNSLAAELFESENPVGLVVRIGAQPFQVIGVLEESGGFGRNSPDDSAYVPLGLAQGRLVNASRYRGDYTVSTIYIEGVNSDTLEAAEKQVETTLRLRHSLQADADNDFQIMNQASLLETASDITATLTLFLGSIGAISLLVGGIGIMNIMLVSVTERTREIGLRKALGARDSDILMQFLVEALVLCLLGGLIGVSLAFGVAKLLTLFPAITFKLVIESDSMALALGFSMLSGLVFGIYPDMRATQLDPIEALRTE